MEDEDRHVREAAVDALVQLGQKIPQSYIDSLLKALRDENEDIRKAARDTLVQLGQEIPQSYIDTLLKDLGDKKRVACPQSCCWCVRPAQTGYCAGHRRLLKAWGDNYFSVREAAVGALVQLQQTTPPVINALLKDFGR